MAGGRRPWIKSRSATRRRASSMPASSCCAVASPATRPASTASSASAAAAARTSDRPTDWSGTGAHPTIKPCEFAIVYIYSMVANLHHVIVLLLYSPYVYIWNWSSPFFAIS